MVVLHNALPTGLEKSLHPPARPGISENIESLTLPTHFIYYYLLAERTAETVNNPLLCHFLAVAVITRTVQQVRILAA